MVNRDFRLDLMSERVKQGIPHIAQNILHFPAGFHADRENQLPPPADVVGGLWQCGWRQDPTPRTEAQVAFD